MRDNFSEGDLITLNKQNEGFFLSSAQNRKDNKPKNAFYGENCTYGENDLHTSYYYNRHTGLKFPKLDVEVNVDWDWVDSLKADIVKKRGMTLEKRVKKVKRKNQIDHKAHRLK